MAQPLDRSEATDCLRALTDGDDTAHDRLLSLVYNELRKKAAAFLSNENPGHTLQPTALVHEAWLRVGEQQATSGETHFRALAAQTMRRVLVDHARRHHAEKRGGEARAVTLHDGMDLCGSDATDALDLTSALDELAEHDARKARVVELRFFGGLSMAEVAEVIEVSQSTVESDWYMARAWLRRRLKSHG